MEDKANEHIETILSSLKDLPPDFSWVKRMLEEFRLPPVALARIAFDIADSCFCEYGDALEKGEVVAEKLLSFYLPEILELLLSYGMNPNEIIDKDNIMDALQWVDYEDCAPKCLKLLLERGGNPNMEIDCESLFEYISFRVGYDGYENKSLVKFWLVLMAYGGCWKDGTIPLEMTEGYEVKIFRDYYNYNYVIEPLEQISGYYGCWVMHIADNKSGIEVARFDNI